MYNCAVRKRYLLLDGPQRRKAVGRRQLSLST